jgi:integrase
MGLTAAKVGTVREPGKYHDRGGLGLFLRVDPGGARYWVQRIMIRGRRREIGLGNPSLVSLAEARAIATANKQAVRAGNDPLQAKREAREAITFADATDRYLAGKLAEFQNEKHAKQWRATLEAYAHPVIGRKLVADIEVRDVLRVLEPIWQAKTETASRLRGRIESVLAWATVAGHRSGDNPARWKGNLAELLPKPGRIAKSDNWPAVALEDAAGWWQALAARDGMAARAVQFLALTAARSGSVRAMTWAEVDFDKALWTIPAEHMKMKREHRVSLTPDALALLGALPRLTGAPVFFSPRGGMLSDMTLSAVMRRMHESEVAAGRPGWLDPRSGRPAVPHGLRSTFRDFAAEHGIEHTVAELCLAHNVGSAVERAYQRSDLLERRRNAMLAWERFLAGETGSRGGVVRLADRR